MALFGHRFEDAPFHSTEHRFPVARESPKNPTTWAAVLGDPYLNEQALFELVSHELPSGTKRTYTGSDQRARLANEKEYGIWISMAKYGPWGILPFFRIKKVLDDKHEEKRSRGPGCYEIARWPENIPSHGVVEWSRNKGRRFKKPPPSTSPGPAFYSPKEPKSTAKEPREKSFRCLMNPHAPERQIWGPLKMTHVGPGWYKYVDATSAFLARGRHGPMHMCTAPRSKYMGNSERRVPATCPTGPADYTMPIPYESMRHPNHAHAGVWSKMSRNAIKGSRHVIVNGPLVPRKSDYLAHVGMYESKSPPKHPSAYKYPFSTTGSRSRKDKTAGSSSVPPARYEPYKFEQTQSVNAHESLFQSKSVRFKQVAVKAPELGTGALLSELGQADRAKALAKKREERDRRLIAWANNMRKKKEEKDKKAGEEWIVLDKKEKQQMAVKEAPIKEAVRKILSECKLKAKSIFPRRATDADQGAGKKHSEAYDTPLSQNRRHTITDSVYGDYDQWPDPHLYAEKFCSLESPLASKYFRT